jgi:hypothetical protein
VPLLVFSMVKPSSALLFIILALFLPGGVLPVVLSGLVYLGLTLFAISFRPGNILDLLKDLAAQTSHLAGYKGTPFYGNLHAWLAELGRPELVLPASIAVLVVFTIWAYQHRTGDLWLLLGVTAIVTRMWTYHRWYDDGLLLIPMIALFRLMKREVPTSTNNVPAFLFAAMGITMLAPGGLYLLPGPLPRVYTAWESLLWLTTLVFLVRASLQEKALEQKKAAKR